MGGFRADRVAGMVHREITSRLREVKDHRLTEISITRVEVTRDLSIARVWWLPLGGGEPSDTLREGVAVAARKLRGPVGRALRLRHAPELDFRFDEHAEHAFAVNKVLDQLGAERAEREAGQASEPAGDELVDTPHTQEDAS